MEEGLPGTPKSVPAPPALWVWAVHAPPPKPYFTLLKNEINAIREIFVTHGETL